MKEESTIITGERIAEEHGRFYSLGNKEYPSVTTILSNTKDKEFLIKWKERIGVHQAKLELDYANKRGTALHSAVEMYLNNIDTKEIFKKHPTIIPTLTDMKSVLNKNVTQIYSQECPLYSDKYRVAGRIDCVGDWRGVPSIIDFKTSKKPKKEEWIQDYYLQTLCYKLMWEERMGFPIIQTVILVATDFGFPQVFVEPNPLSRIDELEFRINQYHNEYNT